MDVSRWYATYFFLSSDILLIWIRSLSDVSVKFRNFVEKNPHFNECHTLLCGLFCDHRWSQTIPMGSNSWIKRKLQGNTTSLGPTKLWFVWWPGRSCSLRRVKHLSNPAMKNRLHAWCSTQSRLGTLLSSLIVRPGVGPQILRQFRLKDLSIDESVRAWCYVCSWAHQFNCWISFTPEFSCIYCWVLIYVFISFLYLDLHLIGDDTSIR